MLLKTKLYGKVYEFKTIKEVLARANEPKSGDYLAGIAAGDTRERIAAKLVLSELTVKDLRENPAVPYEEDGVTRIIQDDLDEGIYRQISGWSIGELREWILQSETTGEMILKMSAGMTSEVIAGVAKLMGNLDLMYAARKIEVKAHCNTTIGGQGVLASRLQPNHPTDNVRGVAASLLDGLSYGAGDALWGLNPAIDTLESTKTILNLFQEMKTKWKVPTQHCVLSHITTQMAAVKSGAPSDLCFQSIAGSEKACRSFGITIQMLEEANALMQEFGTGEGPNHMYFETGQASELSSGAHYGTDQQTMESRCYGLARHFRPFLVNTVVGFMGPEYLYDGKQIARAALEDNFCGHMHGIPMGCDVCYTNHAKADQNDMDSLLVQMAASGCAYVMGLPQGDDVMLMYQSTSFHDIAAIREMTGLEPIPEFKGWLEKWGIWENGRLSDRAGDISIFK
jgi:ethanolamine ammonia-lyase large subunit